MLEPRLARALDNCLARVHGGEDIEACLASYPREASELGPLLLAAARLADEPQASLSVDTHARNRARLLAGIGRAEAARGRARTSSLACQRLLLVPALAGAAVLALFLGFRSGQAPNSAEAATILTVLQGDVRVETSSGEVPARSGMQIRPGDRIVTLPGARAVLTFLDGTTITLDSDTVIVIRSVVDDAGQVRVSVSQPHGNTWTYVPADLGPARVEIDTPSASLQSNRAAISTSVDNAGGTQVGAQGGPVAVSSGSQSASVTSGSETSVTSAGVVSVPTTSQTAHRELKIEITGPATAFITDPAAATVGIVAPGVPVNQVPNAVVTRSENGMIVTIPNPSDGVFTLGIQGLSGGSVSVTASISGGGESQSVALGANDQLTFGIGVAGNDVQLSEPTHAPSSSVPAGVALPDKAKDKAQATATAATPAPSQTPARTSTPLPAATSIPSATPTSTPVPSATPTRTPTPRPNLATPVRGPGSIDQISPQQISPLDIAP